MSTPDFARIDSRKLTRLMDLAEVAKEQIERSAKRRKGGLRRWETKLLQMARAALAAPGESFGSRQGEFERAVAVARAHIPIVRETSANPGALAIVDQGTRFAVYDLVSAEAGQTPGGLFPPAPIAGVIVAVVDLDGLVAVRAA